MATDHSASATPSDSTETSRILLGGHLSVGSTREWLRAWVAVLILLGPARLVLRLATMLPARFPIRGRSVCRAAERRWARLATRLLGLRIHVSGVEHIDPNERYVVISLHESFADALALFQLPLSLTAVARDELAAFPFLGDHLSRGRHLFIRPERPLQTTRSLLRDSRSAIEAGDSVLLFPQGTILGIEVAFQAGAFRLASRLGCRVLPVVVSGGHRVWEHPYSSTLRTNQSMSLTVLPPVRPEEALSRQKAIERRMKDLALASPTPPRRFNPSRDGYWDAYRYEIDPTFPDLAHRIAVRRALKTPDTS